MRLTFWSQIIFVISLTVLLTQSQIGEAASSKQDEVTSTVLPSDGVETTTKKSGFFGGIKKFFSRSSTTTPVPVDQTTKTVTSTVRPTTKPQLVTTPTATKQGTTTIKPNPSGTSAKTPIVSPSNPQKTPDFGGIVGKASPPPHPPGFPTLKPQKPLPSGLELSYGGGEIRPPPRGIHSSSTPVSGMKIDVTSTTLSTPSNVNNPKIATTPSSPILLNGPTFATTTTTRKPIPPKEDFPALPTPKHPPVGFEVTPQSIPLSTPTNVWNKPNLPASNSQHPTNGLSFVPHSPDAAATTTTVRPGFPTDKPTLATDDEIRKLTEDLYAKETNSEMNRIHVHLQGKTRSIDSTDEAPQPLLEIDEKAFETPSIIKMRALFNNYEMDAAVNEYVSAVERQEEEEFISTILTTSLMRHTMLFLQNKGIITSDPKTHKDLLRELWFTQYSRLSGKVGSSGFEHVFANEVKNGTIIGLHNWVYFYEQEKTGNLDYKGYLNSVDLGEKGKVVKVRFTHNGNNKPVNTLFIGTSPELEIALYTLCFKLRPDRTCPVSLGGTKLGIVTYSWRHRGKDLIGSAFPEI